MTLVIILMSVCSPLQAGQPDKVKREKKERAFPSEQMINELKLTDKQVAKLKEGNADIKSEMKALRDKNKLAKKEMKESMNKIKDARKEMIKKSMTTEQYITYLELQVERLQKMNFKKGKKLHAPKPQFEHQKQKPQAIG